MPLAFKSSDHGKHRRELGGIDIGPSSLAGLNCANTYSTDQLGKQSKPLKERVSTNGGWVDLKAFPERAQSLLRMPVKAETLKEQWQWSGRPPRRRRLLREGRRSKQELLYDSVWTGCYDFLKLAVLVLLSKCLQQKLVLHFPLCF